MSERFIVNALVRQALVAIQEVMGENGLNAVLRTSGLGRFVDNFPPDDLEPGIRASEYPGPRNAHLDFRGCRILASREFRDDSRRQRSMRSTP